MNPASRRAAFRRLLAGDGCVRAGSVHDAISVRLADALGFKVGMLGGSIAALAVLGAPDLTLLSLTELAEQTRRICRAGELPVIVDADHGFGGALNVIRTVEELETAGAAGLTIEDTHLPHPFGEKRPKLLSFDESLGKIRAAVAGRNDPQLVVIGRTSAFELTDAEDAIARGRAYEAAGVDAMFFTGVETRAQLDLLASELRGPFILGNVPEALGDPAAFARCRVRVLVQGHQPFMAGIQAVHATLKALREGVAPDDLEGLPDRDLIRRVTRAEDYARQIENFLGG